MDVRHILLMCVTNPSLGRAISMTVFFFFNFITLLSFEGIISLGLFGSLKELCFLVEQIALPYYNGSSLLFCCSVVSDSL